MKDWDFKTITWIVVFLLFATLFGFGAIAYIDDPSAFGRRDAIECFLGVVGAALAAYQLWRGREKPTNPVKPFQWTEPHGKMEASDFLNWRTRLSETLVGRENEIEELLRWARTGGGVEVRFLSGLGGAGKTRLAFEVADVLRKDGWQAGQAEDAAAQLLPKAKLRKLLLIVDYPEDAPERTKKILQALAELPEDAGPVRALFVSRYSKDRWEREIGTIDSELVAVRLEREALTLLKLNDDQAVQLFGNAAARCAAALGKAKPDVAESAVRDWLRDGKDRELFLLPLFVSAAAVHCVLNDATVVDLTAAQVMGALVRRETRRMRKFGKERGIPQENPLVERLVALATIRSGLDARGLRSLAKDSPGGLAFPKDQDVIDWVERLDWWHGDVLQPLRPDALGAALAFEVLKQRPSDAPEWLWSVLGNVPDAERPNWLAAVERIDYDIRRIYGETEDRFCGWLAAMIAGKLQRAQTLEYVTQDRRAMGTLDLSLAIEAALLFQEPSVGEDGVSVPSDVSDSERAGRLTNYSVHLSDRGKGAEALAAVEEAVEIRWRLAKLVPERHETALASSLTNYSNRLGAQGRGAEALAAIKEAVEIRRRLAKQTPERYEPELALSLTNYSVHLRGQGKGDEALAAIEQAVEIRRRLAK
ncbi:MAG: tetratricopeptide repeat protein [Acidobacteria bacterium]|nr:tetratricopeptide repeat protein [Acidobacteriota bacterium]